MLKLPSIDIRCLKNEESWWPEDADEIQRQYFRQRKAALVALVAGASMLLAQWPKHRTEGPRTESGDLDLKAPAPKAPDGHPDLSGLWQPMRGNFGNLKGKGKGHAAPARAPGEPPAAQFATVGAGFENGLPFTEWGGKPGTIERRTIA